ncbi:MAG: DUF4364 family protein [Clostridia bacterium]|nr:DUF4364 family protein [Clostridia bacterium]
MQAPLKDKNDIKIFILYLLKNLKYPLDFNTISDIVVQDEFVNYFDFAECFAELLDAGTIEQLRVGDVQTEAVTGKNGRPEKKSELYRITDNGVQVVEQLQSNLLNMIREKSLKSAMRLLSFKSRGSEVRCSTEPRPDGRWDLHCEVIEGGSALMKLQLVIETKYQLDKMVYNFNERPEVVYRGIISLLTGDINYLID